MVLSVPVIALGATLGTATSILALCGVTCLCRHMHPKKGLLPRDREPDPEKARPGVLQPAQQVSGAWPSREAGSPGCGGDLRARAGAPRPRCSLRSRTWLGGGRGRAPGVGEAWGGSEGAEG